MRLEGLSTLFDLPAEGNDSHLCAIAGNLAEMLNRPDLDCLVLDMGVSAGGVALIDSIRRARPSLPLLVIGPEGQDEVVLESIIAGARAYLDLNADTPAIRQALDVVLSGSIWATRRILSKLVDRLLKAPDSSLTNASPHLTDREKEVLELILLARSNREIAHHLGIEERTVKAHVGRLMRKTGSDNRIELTMRALNHTTTPNHRFDAHSPKHAHPILPRHPHHDD